MGRIDVNNTFSPAQEIIVPQRFAGRKEPVKKAVQALGTAGRSILVFGERGVGKTSFVEMVKLIAQDQVELIHRYRFQHLTPSHGFQYKVACVECDEDVDTTEAVLQRLITSPEGIRGLVGPRMRKIEQVSKDRYVVNVLRKLMVIDSSEEQKVIKEEFQEKSLFELFTNLVLLIIREVLEPDEGLLIVVDEFDQVKNKRGFSSLIKTLSKNKVKFLVSGVAESYFELLGGHASIERQLHQGTIMVTPMSRDEVDELFNLVTQNTKGLVTFEAAFKDEVFNKSHGYPYFVQLFGQLALTNFVEVHGADRAVVLTKEYLRRGLEDFASHDPKNEEIYSSIIGSDPEREMLLKALAMHPSERIRESGAIRYCEIRNVKSPKRILATLLAHKEPEVLSRLDKDFVRFREPLFKIYANVRKPVLMEETANGYRIPIGSFS